MARSRTYHDEQHETAVRTAQLVAHEQADTRRLTTGTLSPGYLRGVHPDTGANVTFVPGELLPPWAAEQLQDAPQREGITYLGTAT